MDNKRKDVDIKENIYNDPIGKVSTKILYFQINDKYYFASSSIIKALQYKKNSQLENAKRGISKDLKFEGHIHQIFIGNQKRNFLDCVGLELFLKFCSRTHPTPVRRLTEFLVDMKFWKGFSDNIILPLSTKESNTITSIQQATFRFESQTSYFIKGEKNRKIDLFFPKQKIAIECNEGGHEYYDKKDEEKRRVLINDLGIQIYNFNPDSKDFDIFKVIGDIFELLYKK